MKTKIGIVASSGLFQSPNRTPANSQMPPMKLAMINTNEQPPPETS